MTAPLQSHSIAFRPPGTGGQASREFPPSRAMLPLLPEEEVLLSRLSYTDDITPIPATLLTLGSQLS
eukprot:CAMPEP_0181251214 /NCGR_PEP_ID=MMETSP1096-20121128/46755_1 /TAXON_ID=156174 ORGANISM="Chrysochromulina ericina, Strain CCMP281" /NCGR_SAMPLE_ID=MMETSP1096 /ASSEMBLY_ACC=CAM_ASM_000453 /LENGTH=66 /DNA_ID=CAMNT_0023348777 /DNA_START=569 /DNA_END=769 /DNA_ORIENTATION=+